MDRRKAAAAMVGAFAVTTAVSAEQPSWYGAESILSWVSSDKSTKISAADARLVTRDTYTLEFVCYLGRFLLNFDQSCAAWWQQQQQTGFSEFVTSVEYGLLRYPGRDGAAALAKSLERQHGDDPEKRRHLALAFALLQAPVQPVDAITRLLQGVKVYDDIEDDDVPTTSDPPRRYARGGPRKRVDRLASLERFDNDPLALFPPSQIPVLNDRGIYEIKGLAPYMQRDTIVDADPDISSSATSDESPAVDVVEEAKKRPTLLRSTPGSVMAPKNTTSVFGSVGKQRVFRERTLDVGTYAFFAAAGAVGCALTHVGVVPLDVVKTRMQTDPTNDYKNTLDGMRKMAHREGWRSLSLGLGPTLVGYMWYGATVYPGFEFFTRCFTQYFPGDGYHAPIVLVSGALATIGACIGACPAEAVRIRVVAAPEKYAIAGGIPFISPTKRVFLENGLGAFYAGFRPLVVRQVIFGVVKFFFFDSLAEMIFTAAPHLRAFAVTRLLVAFVSGFVAGTFSSLVSQPADAILTYTNERSSVRPTEAAKTIWQDQGIRGFYKGALTRAMWSAAVISGQFAIYDLLKSFLGVSATDLTLFLDVQL